MMETDDYGHKIHFIISMQFKKFLKSYITYFFQQPQLIKNPSHLFFIIKQIKHNHENIFWIQCIYQIINSIIFIINILYLSAMDFDYNVYSKKMRAALSSQDMYNSNYTLNHQYFNTKKGYYWSNQNTSTLKDGIKQYGVGQWKKINQVLFQGKKSQIQLQLRTCILLNVNDLSDYNGKKIDLNECEKQQGTSLKKRGKKN